MPDLIRHPVPFWIPAFAGMTVLVFIAAGVINEKSRGLDFFRPFYSIDGLLSNTIAGISGNALANLTNRMYGSSG
jgi:hypothetical protein